jgi:hypothetical protein
LRVAVAFEALVNLVTADRDPNEPITTTVKYRRLRKALEETLKGVQQGAAPLLNITEVARFKKKLEQLNLGSNTKRIAKFWDETKVVRSKSTDELIRRLRNDSVHQGFVGDESSRRAMWRNHDDANRLINIFNRSLLSYLGYRGPVRTADNKGWVHARSGRKYTVPALPPGPQIQINITTTLPPLTPTDSTAFAGLQKLLQILGSTSYAAGTVASVPTSGHDIMYFNSSGAYVSTQLPGSTFRNKAALTGLVVNPSLPNAQPFRSPFKMTDYQWAIQISASDYGYRPSLPVHFVSAQTLTTGTYTFSIPSYDEYDLFDASGNAVGWLDVLRAFPVSVTVDTATIGIPVPMTALIVHPEYSHYAADAWQEHYQMILQTSGAAAGDNGGINT